MQVTINSSCGAKIDTDSLIYAHHKHFVDLRSTLSVIPFVFQLCIYIVVRTFMGKCCSNLKIIS